MSEAEPGAPQSDPGRRSRLRSLFRSPLDDSIAGLEAIAAGPSPVRGLALMCVGLVATWFAYVSLHELLHVAGCVATGGTVTELQLDPLYGGALLGRVFPFVVAGGDYPGRLSGFDTGGSDAVYLATDFAPYLLSILIGVPLIRCCGTRARPFLFGAAAVLALAPFYNVPGDYYEMGSILTTRAAALLSGGEPLPYANVRTDDLFALVGQLVRRPGELGLVGPGPVAIAAILIPVSSALSVLLAFLTYAAGGAFAAALRRLRRRPI